MISLPQNGSSRKALQAVHNETDGQQVVTAVHYRMQVRVSTKGEFA